MQGGYALCFLCLLGFLKEFRPSESFLTNYLVVYKNITQEQVSQEIYPVGTYSTLLLLIAVFLVTDILFYKPVIIVHSLAGVICYCLISFGTSKEYVQAAEVFYGLFVASEVAYSTYMYASSEKESYQKITSYTRIALQSGRLVSGLMGQVLISCGVLNFHELNYLSLAGLSLSTVFGCLLPSARQSVYFHRIVNGSGSETETVLESNDGSKPSSSAASNLLKDQDELETVKHLKVDEIAGSTVHGRNNQDSGFEKILHDFLHAYSNLYVVKWSLWWSLTQCGYLQVTSYVQNLWQDTVDLSDGLLYNGFASASYTILSIAASWIAGQLKFDSVEQKSMWLLSICAFLSGALVIFSTISNSLHYQYVFYGIFKILYQTMMIFANSEVAKSLTGDSHGLIFGVNTFVALLLQTILTVIVNGKGGLELSTHLQFFVYGAYYIVIGFGFGIVAITTVIMERSQRQREKERPSPSEEF